MQTRQFLIASLATVAAMLGYLVLGGSIAAAAPQHLDDQDITLAVQTELALEDGVPSHLIDVDVTNGIVTLSGSVDSYSAKLLAENVAKTVKGVLAVINNIEVRPTERTDAQIRSDVIAALAGDPVTDSWEIEVEAKDGIVTLKGAVNSYTEKNLADDVAGGVKGVKAVNNRITYQYEPDRSDADIQADVEHQLKADASIDSGLIDVAVDGGVVTLSGSVGSSAEKAEATTDAWAVAGVKSVNAEDLDVQWWLADEMEDHDETWTDEATEQAVEGNLLYNPRVASFNVTVDVTDGVATLTGTVEDYKARQAAEEEAEQTLGVRRVKNYLLVRPPVTKTDMALANDVRAALRRDPYVERYDVRVSAANGKVYLNGTVDSWYMKDQAEDAAAGVQGVVEVQNNLAVDYEITTKTDAEIKEDVEDQMWWSPFVDSDDITVEVHEGVATLWGTVEDWDEYQAAKENAREGGATSVISKLEISASS